MGGSWAGHFDAVRLPGMPQRQYFVVITTATLKVAKGRIPAESTVGGGHVVGILVTEGVVRLLELFKGSRRKGSR